VDVLWTPWRYSYISGQSGPSNAGGCVFCNILNGPGSDEEKLILTRAGHNFVVLNIFPYGTGHLLIVPYDHLAQLDQASKPVTDEMMDLTKRCQAAIADVYQPHGFNIGMNVGKAAGAGVADHFHMHVLPRWFGDSNFMTPIAETRTIPESLETTYAKLKGRI
jgi:ATP adenylyltransferase